MWEKIWVFKSNMCFFFHLMKYQLLYNNLNFENLNGKFSFKCLDHLVNLIFVPVLVLVYLHPFLPHTIFFWELSQPTPESSVPGNALSAEQSIWKTAGSRPGLIWVFCIYFFACKYWWLSSRVMKHIFEESLSPTVQLFITATTHTTEILLTRFIQ